MLAKVVQSVLVRIAVPEGNQARESFDHPGITRVSSFVQVRALNHGTEREQSQDREPHRGVQWRE